MKKALRIFGAIFALGMLFFGCNNGSQEPESTPPKTEDKPDKVEYSISFDNKLLPTKAGETNAKLLSVTATGTVIVNSSDEDIAKAEYDAEAKKIKVTGVAFGTADITAYIKEDTSKTVTVPVTVKAETEEKLKAKFVFEEGINPAYFEYVIQDSDKEDYKYRMTWPVKKYIEGGEDDLVSNLYVNADGYVNVKFIAAYDENDKKIENLVLKSGDSEWFNFDEKKSAGVSFTYGYPSEEKADLTLTFKGFTVPGGSVKINYGADTGTYVDADCTVSEDGASATVSLEKKYANSYDWFNNVTVTVKDKDGKALETSYTNYFEYKAEGISLDVSAKDTSEWKDILAETSYSFDGNLKEIVSASSFTDLTVTKLKVEIYEVSGSTSDGWWFTIATDSSSWANQQKVEWVSGSYYSTIVEGDKLAAYKEKGILLAGSSGLSAKVKVTYQ